MKFLSTFLFFAIFTTTARAGLWIQTGITTSQFTDDQQTLGAADLRILSSSTVGWTFPQGFIVGAQLLYSRDTLNVASTWGLGPKGGILIHGFELTAAYLPSVNDALGATTRSGGGYAINLGYHFHIKGPLRVGLIGTYWSTTYTQLNNQTLIVKQNSSQLSPQLSIALDF